METCFPCLGARKSRVPTPPVGATPGDPPHHRNNVAAAARTFSFGELAAATGGFRDAYLVAGRKKPSVYKGYLTSVNQAVAMKLQHLVDRDKPTEQLNSEFLARVLMLNALRHPNVVNFIGFCAEGSHRILVHEWMLLGSLEDHLHDPSPDKARLEWSTRMNIAAGVARALEYLHDKGMACRCLRTSDILLGDGDGCHAKLSQYVLVKAGQRPDGRSDARHFADTMAPETCMTGTPTAAADVYSFGVVLLQMITGLRAWGAVGDQNLVAWARPLLEDRAEFYRMADPALQGRYPPMDLQEALAVVSMCIHQDPAMRSPIGAVVTALARLAYHRPS
ncbi:unnamed protein product [Alopecurus aequalis]